MEEIQGLLNIREEDLEVQEWIGSGCSGVVFKGIWRVDGEELIIAIKKMKVTDKDVVAEICKEFKSMTGLPHEYFCKVYGGCWASKSQEVWVIMEYLEGGNFHDFVQKYEGIIPRDLQLSFFIQATKALNSLHHNSILHKDIKSLNFLVRNRSKLVLTDFGLSKAKTYINSNTFTINTVRWGAPEIVTTHKPHWSEKSDIYSLGMMFCEIITRNIPYHEDSNLGTILHKIKSKIRPKLPDDCPKEFVDIIHHCLKKKPSKRPSAHDLLKQLEKLGQPLKEEPSLKLNLRRSLQSECKEYRIVIVGAAAVGKSSLAIRFVSGTFSQKYDPTIEENYTKQIEIDGKSCLLNIMDTAGQEEYSALRDSHMNTADGFVIVYSITDVSSFERTSRFRENIIRGSGASDIPIMLVGNKAQKDSSRLVSKKEAKKTAERWGTGFTEASAKTPKKVCEIFLGLVKLIDKWRDVHPNLHLSNPLHRPAPQACVLL